MKTKLLFYTLLISLLVSYKSSYSQVNTYLQNNPVWQMTSTCTYGGFCIKNELMNYYVKGDTVIDTLEYALVYKKAQGSLFWNAGGNNFGCEGNYATIDANPSYFIRSFDKQMYIRLPQDTAEQLLYNFDLALGDTLPLSYTNYALDIVVSSIDSIYTAHGYRKRFTLAGNTWSSYLLEGIGHSRGLVEQLKAVPLCTYNLACFGLNDTAYFPALGSTCEVAIGIYESTKLHPLSVYPNPASTGINFEYPEDLQNVQLKLVNLVGVAVYPEISQQKGKLYIQPNSLSPGIYFYEFTAAGTEKKLGKLIIN